MVIVSYRNLACAFYWGNSRELEASRHPMTIYRNLAFASQSEHTLGVAAAFSSCPRCCHLLLLSQLATISFTLSVAARRFALSSHCNSFIGRKQKLPANVSGTNQLISRVLFLTNFLTECSSLTCSKVVITRQRAKLALHRTVFATLRHNLSGHLSFTLTRYVTPIHCMSPIIFLVILSTCLRVRRKNVRTLIRCTRLT